MVAAAGDGDDAGLVDAAVKIGDLLEARFEMEGPLDPGVAEVADAAEVEGRHPARLVDLADERGLVADLARSVSRAGAVGDAAVEGDADEADLGPGPVVAGVRRAHEGRYAGVARTDLRVGEFRGSRA